MDLHLNFILRVCHTLLNSVNKRPTENKIFNPFVSVRMRFLSFSHLPNAFLLIWRMRSLSGKVHSIWRGIHRKKVPAERTVAMRWHAFCLELVRSWSCIHPFASIDVWWTWFGARLLSDMQRVKRRCSGHWPHVQRTIFITDKKRIETDE